MKLLTLTVSFFTPTMPDPEADDACSRLELAMKLEANRAARETAAHFGHDITANVEEL